MREGMSDTLNVTPRRLVPLVGPLVWSAAELAPSDCMIPLGAEHAAELEAARSAIAAGVPSDPTPRLDMLAEELRSRLDHGRGFALLRGLHAAGDPDMPLRILAGRLGEPCAATPATGRHHGEACDALLLRMTEPATARLRSAAAVHNALLRADRAGLSALYETRGEPPLAVFSHEGGIFGGRWDDEALPAGLLPVALEAAMGEPMTLSLRVGDILALNPFLVWAERIPGAVVTACREVPSRLDNPGFAALR